MDIKVEGDWCHSKSLLFPAKHNKSSETEGCMRKWSIDWVDTKLCNIVIRLNSGLLIWGFTHLWNITPVSKTLLKSGELTSLAPLFFLAEDYYAQSIGFYGIQLLKSTWLTNDHFQGFMILGEASVPPCAPSSCIFSLITTPFLLPTNYHGTYEMPKERNSSLWFWCSSLNIKALMAGSHPVSLEQIRPWSWGRVGNICNSKQQKGEKKFSIRP